MATPDQREHALKLRDEVTWLIDGLKSFAAADREVGTRAAAWAELLVYLVSDLDHVIGEAPPTPGEGRWDYADVVALLAKLLASEGKGSDEGAEHMAREFIREWLRTR